MYDPLWFVHSLFSTLTADAPLTSPPGLKRVKRLIRQAFSLVHDPPPRTSYTRDSPWCCRSHMWRTYVQHATYYSGSFLDDNKTNIHNDPKVTRATRSWCLGPLIPPDLLDFMCLTRVSASLRHVCCFYQMSCSPGASLVEDPLPSIVLLPTPASPS